jgi:hypothetical protein
MTTKTWNGATADWYANSGGDWTPAGDPGPSDNVVINSGDAQLLSGDAAISVASITVAGGSLAIQDPGKTQSVNGNVSVTGTGWAQVDGVYVGGAGGSALTIGGNLTNSSTSGAGVSVGNTGITSASTLTVNGTGGLSNGANSYIYVEGSATVQGTLNVANAAAGFGTTGVETGTVILQNDALLEFKSGEIATVNGELELVGKNSRVADAGSTASNSALTGLTSVAGNFWLTNGATVAPTGNLSVTGAGTAQVDGVYAGGAGGSALTIGGNLTNSSTSGAGVSVGNTGITSASTLTVKGAGGLSNTGMIYIEGGSASATGNLVVTRAATNSAGTIVVGNFGKLTAGAVDITGGTLEGVGTIAGALNVTGGTVVGGTLNSNPGTLHVSGAYNQSKTGILQADIDTSLAQQSSIIAVSGSPGTPGSPGSVNLAGGTLLIDALSNLALNTPYTVMTFGAGHLYGQFAQLRTEGTLGSHTGNGDSVNLGNGDTLKVLYNEASGQVQVEMVTMPSNAYTWQVGSGTWSASSGADWNPPGDGTTPSATSNVTIGSGGGGTVTLAQDQAISSLSLTSGYTLSGSANSITTTGNVSVASGATLSIDDMNVGGSFTDNGSATFAGALTMNGASQFTLSNASLSGGIDGTGVFKGAASTTNTLTNVTIYKGTTFTASSGDTTKLSTALTNEGTFVIDGSSANSMVNLVSNVTLSGGGVVTMKAKTGAAYLRGGGFTLTNANDTIRGAGFIGDNAALAIVNKGTIDANASGQNLNVGLGGGTLTNTGILEATSGGHLFVAGAIGGGGQLKIGAGSVVELGGATSENSTFLGASSAKLRIDNATTNAYTGVINSFVVGDTLELGNTNATSATPTFNGTNTILTVDVSGGSPLTYALAGDLSHNTFTVTHVGADSDIVDPPAAFAEAFSLLRDPLASNFADSHVFGASNSLSMASSAQLNLAESLHSHT